MGNNIPRISIGLAVYNGERYLAQAIDSILAQTYQDFELILSDNASTDATEAICLEYAARDTRIHYYRNSKNIGGANNENQTFRLARGEYFRWAAYDDVLAPEFLSRAVEILDQKPEIVICDCLVVDINEHGESIKISSQRRKESLKPHERFSDLASDKHDCNASYGLIRSDILRKTKLQQNYTGSDRTLICELSLYGQFFEIQEPLFYKRYHQKNAYVDMRARMAWFNPALKGKIVLPYWMQFFDYVNVISRVPVSASERIYCYLYMIRWCMAHLRNLAGDVLLALLGLFHFLDNYYSWRNKDKNIYNWE